MNAGITVKMTAHVTSQQTLNNQTIQHKWNTQDHIVMFVIKTKYTLGIMFLLDFFTQKSDKYLSIDTTTTSVSSLSIILLCFKHY